LNFDDLRDATIAFEFSRVEIGYKTRGYMRNFTSTLLWYQKLKVTFFYGREGGSMNGATLPLSSSRPSISPSRGHACDEEKLKKVGSTIEKLHAKRPVEPVQLIPSYTTRPNFL
jgi:hypothetical protein